jgi:hypothetical protein
MVELDVAAVGDILIWEDVDAGGGVVDLAASVIGSVIEDTLLDSKS